MSGIDEVANRLARQTVPADNNDSVRNGLLKASNIVEQFVDDTNGWFRIHDVRVYSDNEIGIVADWKWTIERWVAAEMDDRLEADGWENFAHLKADRKKEPNEAEFRYMKFYGDTRVYLNSYVTFTKRAFEALEEGRDIVEYGDKEVSERVMKARERLADRKKKDDLMRQGVM